MCCFMHHVVYKYIYILLLCLVNIMESKVGKLKTKAKSPKKVDVHEKSVGHTCMNSDSDSDEYEMEVESEGKTSSEYEANTETDTTETEDSVDLGRQV